MKKIQRFLATLLLIMSAVTMSAQMEMPSVQGHYALAGAAARQSVIDLADGGSLLTHTPVGAGHIYLFTCPLDAQWTDFVAQALFV